jgi:hypothetical protein
MISDHLLAREFAEELARERHERGFDVAADAPDEPRAGLSTGATAASTQRTRGRWPTLRCSSANASESGS